MRATNRTAAGVYINEIDRSQQNTVPGSTIYAIVSASNKGRIGERVFYSTYDAFEAECGKPEPKLTKAHYAAKQFFAEGNQLYFTRVAQDAMYGGVMISQVSNLATTHPVDGFDDVDLVDFIDTDIMLVYGANPGEWNNDMYVVFYPDTNDPDNDQFIFELYEEGNGIALERYTCTTFEKTNENGKQLFVETINDVSKRIRVVLNRSNATYLANQRARLINAVGGGPRNPLNPTLPNGQLSGGTNGDLIDINASDATVRNNSIAAIISAWDLYADWETVHFTDACDAGYTHPAIQQHIVTLCERRMSSFAMLNVPSHLQSPQDAVNYRHGLATVDGVEFGVYSSYAALYTSDAIIRDTDRNMDVQVPASIVACRQYAFTDKTAGKNWAPAGLVRGVLPDVLSLTKRYELGDRNLFAQNGINPLINKPGFGSLLYDARTLHPVESAFQDIGVRRMLCAIYYVLRIAALPSVFEPINSTLFAKVRRELADLLDPFVASQGLDWYGIVCDETNNTNATIANGDVICEVFLDPTRYTKRIHINANVVRTGGIRSAEQIIARP